MAMMTISSPELFTALSTLPMPITEEDGDASQNRNRSALQFARVRIVHDVFQQGDLDQTGMNPTDDQQREEEGD